MFLRGGQCHVLRQIRRSPLKRNCFDIGGPPFVMMQSVAQFGRAEQTCFVQVTWILRIHASLVACNRAHKTRCLPCNTLVCMAQATRSEQQQLRRQRCQVRAVVATDAPPAAQAAQARDFHAKHVAGALRLVPGPQATGGPLAC